MKAAVYYGPQNLKVEEVPNRELKDNEVRVKVKYCGVCGTDIHIYNGSDGAFEVNPPLIPGHEFSGVVEEVGSQVKEIKVGDKVSVDPNDMCGECYYCKNGMQHFCMNTTGIGTTVDGGFAEYVIAREKQVYKVPDQLTYIEAAMAEPVSCCIHGIDLCNIKMGDTVLVMGGGPIGIIMLQLAKNAGASTVILSEPVKEKRMMAEELGADLTINPLEEDAEAVLASNCKNVNVVIECVGNIHTQKEAIRLAGKGAAVMYFGVNLSGDSFAMKPDDIFRKELRLLSSFINPYTFERAIQVLASGQIRVDCIVADVVPLQMIEDALTKEEYRRKGKVMIQMS